MKVAAITLGFVPARIFKESMAQFYGTKNQFSKVSHHFLYQHYPLEKVKNEAELREICWAYEIQWHDAGRNLGLHEGWNYVMGQIEQDYDAYIGFDPDSYPLTIGWDVALVGLLHSPTVWSSLVGPRMVPELKLAGGPERRVRGILSQTVTKPIVNSICAWQGAFLRRVGGLKEHSKWYGHLEAAMWDEMTRQGEQWSFLPEFNEDDRLRDMADRAYTVWKWNHAHLRITELDFESWLATNPEIPPGPIASP